MYQFGGYRPHFGGVSVPCPSQRGGRAQAHSRQLLVALGPSVRRLKRKRTANMLGISERQAARRTTPADTRCHESAQRAGSTEHTDWWFTCAMRSAPESRRPARTCCSELEARQGGSDMIECLPGAHWPGSAWGCSVLELPGRPTM